MRLTRLALAAASAAVLLLSGCEDPVGEVRDTYDQYMSAKERNDADTVLALTDPAYIEHLDFIVKMARSGERGRVMNLTPAERVSIVRIRNRLNKKELDELDGKGWLVRTVKEGWGIDEILGVYGLGPITVRRPRAYATMMLGDYETSFKMQFVKTGDRWVIDPTAVEELINDFLRKQKSSNEAENLFIRERESMRSGKPVRDSIWDTPR